MNRLQFFFDQRVTEADLVELQDNIEDYVQSPIVTLFGTGIASGGEVTAHDPPNLTVDVAAIRAYENTGRRIKWDAAQNVNLAVDKDGNSTAVGMVGQERWLTLCVYFKWVDSDPRVDGHGETVQYKRTESFEFKVLAGAAAAIGTAVRPAKPTDGGIVLADIRRYYGQTTIQNADIDMIMVGRRDLIKSHAATAISFTPAGNLVAITVDGALKELDAEKVAKAGDAMTGFLTLHADPTQAMHAATKQYVDAARQGLDWKASVRVATTANIALSGLQTIDGVALVAGDRVLVKNQSTPSQNGIYVAASEAWTRADDANTSAKVTPGMYCLVEDGTTQGNSAWVLSNRGVVVLGTTDLTFVQFSGAGQLNAGDGVTKTGNTLAVVLTDTAHGQRGGGNLHALATTNTAGFISGPDKTKLDGIAAGAEVNQNAFANVKVGATTAAAGTKTDTLELVAGTGIKLDIDPATKRITISAVYTA